MNGGDDCRTPWIVAQKCTLKNVQKDAFYGIHMLKNLKSQVCAGARESWEGSSEGSW